MSPDEFYHLNDDELLLAKEKRGNKNKLGFAVQLKYFQLEGHHPKNIKVIDPYMLSCKEWPVINLIDVLKETELDIEFADVFHTVASRESLPDNVLRFRLLLCLYALGTNTGLKAISSANNDASESNLRYVKRKFINVDAVRQAIVKVINNTLEISWRQKTSAP